MNIITRFAPSPTGFLHIGGARTALFNYLFAKNNNGKFLIRIEDTDKKRSTLQAIEAIKQGLFWLGLHSDAKIILQSQNIERHKEVVANLVNKEQAYYCYTSSEELEEMRNIAEKKGEVFRFKSQWRNKFLSQNTSIKPVVRIKSPIEGEMVIKDLIQGEVKVKNCELDDMVILRSDETPTYMLAVVVDDFDMQISHIIRGDDHLSNAFRQQIIYQAMGWKVPEFAHIPLIYGADGAKMSKRHGATSVIEYKEMGYLPETIRNYLLRLGWSHGDDEIISDQDAIKWFNLKSVGKSPSRFDFAKLNNLNKYYLQQKDEEQLFNLLPLWFRQQIEANYTKTNQENNVAKTNYVKARIMQALKFIKQRAVKICDLTAACQIYLDNFSQNLEPQDLEIIKNNLVVLEELRKAIFLIQSWSHEEIKNAINHFAVAQNLKIKDFGPALRIVLTFSSSSAGGVFEIIEILGKEQVIKRIDSALQSQI